MELRFTHTSRFKLDYDNRYPLGDEFTEEQIELHLVYYFSELEALETCSP